MYKSIWYWHVHKTDDTALSDIAMSTRLMTQLYLILACPQDGWHSSIWYCHVHKTDDTALSDTGMSTRLMTQLYLILAWIKRGAGNHQTKPNQTLAAWIFFFLNNGIESTILDFIQSPHCIANCLQHACSSGPGAIVCKSHATHWALITYSMLQATWYKGTAQLLSLTELKSHPFYLDSIGCNH